MKRFAIFVLLGPLLTSLIVFVLLMPFNDWLNGHGFSADLNNLGLAFVFLPYAYLFGIVPSVATALLDGFLAKRGFRYRWACCAVLGGVALSLILMMTALPLGSAVLGLVGAFPAAVCSWLSGNRQA